MSNKKICYFNSKKIISQKINMYTLNEKKKKQTNNFTRKI